MTDSAEIEHLRELNHRLAVQVERLESELIKERAHSRRLTDAVMYRSDLNKFHGFKVIRATADPNSHRSDIRSTVFIFGGA